jgi:hypothetical protein
VTITEGVGTGVAGEVEEGAVGEAASMNSPTRAAEDTLMMAIKAAGALLEADIKEAGKAEVSTSAVLVRLLESVTCCCSSLVVMIGVLERVSYWCKLSIRHIQSSFIS